MDPEKRQKKSAHFQVKTSVAGIGNHAKPTTYLGPQFSSTGLLGASGAK